MLSTIQSSRTSNGHSRCLLCAALFFLLVCGYAFQGAFAAAEVSPDHQRLRHQGNQNVDGDGVRNHRGVCANNPGSYVCERCPPQSSPSADGCACKPSTVSARFTLTDSATAPNGAWSWFEDERAIIDQSNPSDPRLLVSSVSSSANGDPESGDVDVLWRNLGSGTQGDFELHNRLERDDHDSAALYLRPDGRYLAMYSRHIGDQLTRWRISVFPHDASLWEPMQTLDNGAGTTYNNVYYLPNEGGPNGRLYNFTRAVNFDPMVQISDDHGTTWANVGKLLTQGGGGDRPYLRYASDGQRIHFVTTEEHPRDFRNSIYHGYVMDGTLYDSHDAIVDAEIFDSSGVSPTLLTPVFENGSRFGGATMNRAWTISLELDNLGMPATIFTVRANDDAQDHRFLYSRFDGESWHTHEMAAAGGFLYAAEDDYTGLASIDPNNPNVVYMSTRIDPRSSELTGYYELYRGVTEDFGRSWAWQALTEESAVDNIRPVVPDWNGSDTAVVWMQGHYNNYTNWTTEIVGVHIKNAGRRSLLWQGGSSWDTSSTNWDAGAGAITPYFQGDEVAFDDSALSSRVRLKRRWEPSGVAFNNKKSLYTLRGAGIGGVGGLRVLGGGAVRLFNRDNRFTGPTLVSNGRLVLGRPRTLADSGTITVSPRGILESSQHLRLNAQSLIVKGLVVGGVKARKGSLLNIHGNGVVSGDVTVSGSTLSGKGRITGNVRAREGARIVVGGEGYEVTALRGPSLYVDATTGVYGNTRVANGEIFSPSTSGSPGDGLWKQRAFGAGSTIYESGGDGTEDAPALMTILPSLSPGDRYRVSAMFWDAGPGSDAQDWPIRAGFSVDELFLFANAASSDASDLDARGAILASAMGPYSMGPSLFTEGNRTLLGAELGEGVVKPDGTLKIFVDDMPSAIGANNRTWYDGVVLNEMSIVPEVVSLTIEGDVSLDSASTLLFDIYSAQNLDQLEVLGVLDASGSLTVTLHPEAPAPRAGDSFGIILSEWISGTFDTITLPVLPTGLVWDTTNLYRGGVLQVVALP